MKVYPLEIENIGEDTYQLMSRGHHDFNEFMEAVKKSKPTWPMGKPSHIYFKATPRDGYTAWYSECEKGTRGAFPATYTSEAYGDEQWK